MLLTLDEYPYHQVTASFAGVAGSDPQWNDGSNSSFFRNHSWGYQAGRGGPRLYAAPTLGAKRRLPGVRQWVLFDMPDHSGFDPSGQE